MKEYEEPTKIGEVYLQFCGDVPVYNVDESQSTGIVFSPVHKDPEGGHLCYISHETGKITNEDGTPYVPFYTDYKAGCILTHCNSITQFKAQELDKCTEHVKKRLEKMNKP